MLVSCQGLDNVIDILQLENIRINRGYSSILISMFRLFIHCVLQFNLGLLLSWNLGLMSGALPGNFWFFNDLALKAMIVRIALDGFVYWVVNTRLLIIKEMLVFFWVVNLFLGVELLHILFSDYRGNLRVGQVPFFMLFLLSWCAGVLFHELDTPMSLLLFALDYVFERTSLVLVGFLL